MRRDVRLAVSARVCVHAPLHAESLRSIGLGKNLGSTEARAALGVLCKVYAEASGVSHPSVESGQAARATGEDHSELCDVGCDLW